jgi:hypothetical protein
MDNRFMQIELPDDSDLQARAAAAGFASIAHYIQMLIDRDAERVAILEGIAAARAGDVQSFEEFDREFRAKHGIP